jgi:hypothetical protein
MIGTILLILALLIFAVLVWVWVSPKAKPMPTLKKDAKPKKMKSIPPKPLLTLKKVSTHPSAAYKKLVTLLNGDAAAAERIISSVQRANPAKDISWCTDKALLDLERDRRS